MALPPVLVARYGSAFELRDVLRAALAMDIIYVKLSVPPPPGKHTLQLWLGAGLVAAVIAETVGSGRAGEYPLRVRPLDDTHVPELQSLLERANAAPPVPPARKSSGRVESAPEAKPPARSGSKPELDVPPAKAPTPIPPMRPSVSSRPPRPREPSPLPPPMPEQPSDVPPPPTLPRMESSRDAEPRTSRSRPPETLEPAPKPARSPHVRASDSVPPAPRPSRSPRVMPSDSPPPLPQPSRSPRATTGAVPAVPAVPPPPAVPVIPASTETAPKTIPEPSEVAAVDPSLDSETAAAAAPTVPPVRPPQKTMEVDAPPPLPAEPEPAPPPAPLPLRPSEPEVVPETVVFNPDAVLRDPTVGTGSEDETLPRSAAQTSSATRPVKTGSKTDLHAVKSSDGASGATAPVAVSWNIRIAPTTKDPLCGRIIAAGKYVLESVIGQGAIGIVFKASHRDLGRTVAIKVLHPRYRDEPELLKVIRSEARAASLLEHPNVARVYDYGHEPDGLVYIVMEYLSGYTLGNVLGARKKLTFSRTVDLMLQVLSALAAAHERNIVHRDVKPDNVVLVPAQDDEGQPTEIVKVCDFGIAAIGSKQKSEGEAYPAGTPEYMAPEQATGAPVTAAVDVYACGVVLYEMLTGVVPFTLAPGEKPYQLFLKHANDPPRPPSELTPDLPKSLEAIVLRALEKQAERRYPSARDLRLELRKAL